MVDIAVVGLGSMGSALARTFIAGGHKVIVWNRTRERIQPLVEIGALGADSLADAVAAAPVLVVCVGNYAVGLELLGAEAVAGKLSGRTLVQLSTGTAKEARDSEVWAAKLGAGYVDGAIMAFPEELGTPSTLILLAGAEAAYKAVQSQLVCLGGRVTYLGPNVGAAAVLDFALLIKNLGLIAGVAHAASMCDAEGIDQGAFISLLAESDRARPFAEVIRSDHFANPGATTAVWHRAVEKIRRQSRDAGISSQVPDFISGLLAEAIAAGYGDQHIAAIYKVLRRGGN